MHASHQVYMQIYVLIQSLTLNFSKICFNLKKKKTSKKIFKREENGQSLLNLVDNLSAHQYRFSGKQKHVLAWWELLSCCELLIYL